MKAERGVTLTEVLIALFIFAMIATTSVFVMRLGVDSRDQLAAADKALKQLQLARILMKEDFAQAAARPVRDEYGLLIPAAFYGGQSPYFGRSQDDEEMLVAFVRAGWINPDARAPRSALQHVEYFLRAGRLIRRTRPYLDDARGADAQERVMMEGISAARIEFLNGAAQGDMQWIDLWPVSASTTAPSRAVQLVTTDEYGQELRQSFWIGPLGAP